MNKEKLKKYLNKRNYLLGFIVVFILLLIVWGIKGTHAFYNNSTTIPFVNAKVGDFLNRVEGNIDRTSDVNLIYYIESETTPSNYILTHGLPNSNYTFNSSLSKCNLNTANYSFLDDGTVTLKATMTIPNQVVCRLFYKKKNPTHVTIYILEQSEYGTISYDGKKYSLTENMPDTTTHVYSNKYVCQNSATKITYNADTGLSISAPQPDVCNVYFNKK